MGSETFFLILIKTIIMKNNKNKNDNKTKVKSVQLGKILD